MPLTPEEKATKCQEFRDHFTAIGDLASEFAVNDIKATVEFFSAGSTFTLDFGDSEYPSTANVASLVGCDEY